MSLLCRLITRRNIDQIHHEVHSGESHLVVLLNINNVKAEEEKSKVVSFAFGITV